MAGSPRKQTRLLSPPAQSCAFNPSISRLGKSVFQAPRVAYPPTTAHRSCRTGDKVWKTRRFIASEARQIFPEPSWDEDTKVLKIVRFADEPVQRKPCPLVKPVTGEKERHGEVVCEVSKVTRRSSRNSRRAAQLRGRDKAGSVFSGANLGAGHSANGFAEPTTERRGALEAVTALTRGLRGLAGSSGLGGITAKQRLNPARPAGRRGWSRRLLWVCYLRAVGRRRIRSRSSQQYQRAGVAGCAPCGSA